MKKNMMKVVAVLLIGYGLISLNSCKSNDDGPTALTLTSATANGTDINGANAATGIDSSPSIVATFNNDIDATTATNANITLTRSFDAADVPLTIVTSGKVVTITPTTQPLYGGALYTLAVSSNLKSTGGVAIASFTRAFTTAGTFLPSGQVAHWGFENNVNDDAGSGTNYNGAAIDITYAAGRNTAAGQAGSFNGTTSIAEVSNGPSLTNASNFTLSFWTNANYNLHQGDGKMDTVTNFVMGLGGSKGFEWEYAPKFENAKLAASYQFSDGIGSEDLWMDATGNLGWVGWTYSKDLSTSGGLAALAANKWAQIVVTFNGTTKVGTIYVNGVKQKSQDFTLWPDGDRPSATGVAFQSGLEGVGDKFALGYYADRSSTAFNGFADYTDPAAGHYNGLLDDVRIFHRALPEAEITLLYNSEKP